MSASPKTAIRATESLHPHAVHTLVPLCTLHTPQALAARFLHLAWLLFPAAVFMHPVFVQAHTHLCFCLLPLWRVPLCYLRTSCCRCCCCCLQLCGVGQVIRARREACHVVLDERLGPEQQTQQQQQQQQQERATTTADGQNQVRKLSGRQGGHGCLGLL
jgi:hypothetical protein